jgi:hypothetical protein
MLTTHEGNKPTNHDGNEAGSLEEHNFQIEEVSKPLTNRDYVLLKVRGSYLERE